MNERSDGPRWRAALTASLLFLAGAVSGVLADRLWLAPSEAEPPPLTAEAMAAQLDLSAAETERVRALLDTLHARMLAVVQRHPDSLAAAVHDAQRRIEAALPAGARAGFRAWMEDHHERMIGRMHGARAHSAVGHGGR